MEQIDSTLVESASKGSWVAVAALVTWALIAAMKSDRIPINIPPRARPIIALVLGQVFAVLSAVMGGVSWPAAVVSGVAAAAFAIAGQEIGSAAKPTIAKIPPPSVPLATIGGFLLLCLVLMVLGVGCGLSPRHVAAESALGVTDVLEEAEPQIRSQCLLPYAYAVKVDDRASMASIDEECAPKIAAYDGARSLVVATRLALSLDDLDELKRLGPELLAAGQRLLALIGGGR